jgi:hypothetical protein
MRFDTVGEYLKQFGNKIYATKGFEGLSELNMDTFEVKTYDFEDILSPVNMSINDSRFIITNEGLLFFTDGGGRPKNRFGIIDLKKLELLHVEEIEIFDTISHCIQSLQVYDDRVYAHTSDNSLHIYQFSEVDNASA